MPRDINEVILTGEASSSPILVPIKNNKKLCSFELKNLERFTLSSGEAAAHENPLTVEILGPTAEQQARTIQKGSRYFIKGYLRVDLVEGKQSVRVRAFRVELE